MATKSRLPMLGVFAINPLTGDIQVGITRESMPTFIMMLSRYNVVRLPRRRSPTISGTPIFESSHDDSELPSSSSPGADDVDLPQTPRWRRWIKKMGW